MRKIILRLAVLLLALALLVPALALADGLSITTPVETVRPGKAVLISFEAAQDGTADIVLEDDSGVQQSVVVLDLSVRAGVGQVWWNGTYQGVPAPKGTWRLVLRQNGEQAECPVEVGSQAPYLTSIVASSPTLTPDHPLTVTFYAGCAGWVSAGVWQGEEWLQIDAWAVEDGAGSFVWDGEGYEDGTYQLTLLLTSPEGDSSHEEQLSVTLAGFGAEAAQETEAPEQPSEEEPEELLPELETMLPEDGEDETLTETAQENDQRQYTPAFGSPYAGKDTSVNFWTLPMDITDEEAVWAMLTSPITVVDSGSKCTEKTQVHLRALPEENADPVGVVTCKSQGVHVLETLDNGWSLVECYSSSFHDTRVEAWNALVQGYIKTSWLKEVTPNQELGMVIDKLTQRLYIFKDGHLFTTLLVSTGLSNANQPYNETRSGEFITVSKVGEFKSDNLHCAMAIRFNAGDLIHEVPHTENEDGTNNYRAGEANLGKRASHGCVRVQRNRSPEGVNMTWIWNNLKSSSKVRLVIWEDWQGRQIPIPDSDLLVYYNPKGGAYYHSQETCYLAKNRTFTPFTYGELDTGDYASLRRCVYCTPPLRVAEIEAINAEHQLGGDHDPVLTKARKKYYTYLDSIATDLLRN